MANVFAEYNFEIVYIKGINNCLSIFFSRGDSWAQESALKPSWSHHYMTTKKLWENLINFITRSWNCNAQEKMEPTPQKKKNKK